MMVSPFLIVLTVVAKSSIGAVLGISVFIFGFSYYTLFSNKKSGRGGWKKKGKKSVSPI